MIPSCASMSTSKRVKSSKIIPSFQEGRPVYFDNHELHQVAFFMPKTLMRLCDPAPLKPCSVPPVWRYREHHQRA